MRWRDALIGVLIGFVVGVALVGGFAGLKKQPGVSERLLAVVWYQNAGEARALAYQTYQLAWERLQTRLREDKFSKKPAVVVDIDETVLDNSPYEAWLIRSGRQYPEGWAKWVEAAQAAPVTGALTFLKRADSAGVDVFYVSNRKVEYLSATMRNLHRWGFPQVNESHILLRSGTSSKEPRREIIRRTHDVLLYVGDNLNDFSSLFEKKGVAERQAAVEAQRRLFGKRFFVLPNPMYGDWEGAIYHYRWSLPPSARRDSLWQSLRAFEVTESP